MTPAHHPSADRLVQYAAGAMSPGPRLVIECHLMACATCRQEVALAEAIGGALLRDVEPEPLSPDALASALARIEVPGPGRPRGHAAPIPQDWIQTPPEIVDALAKRRRWAAPGVWVAPVRREADGRRSYLLRVAAGMRVPRHTHKGAEMVCLLKGSFVDRGMTFGPGDFVESDEAVDHQPAITREGECVCMVAAESALVPRDWIGRLFQPLVGI